MQALAELIIELRLATRRMCMCEGKAGARKSTLSLRTKVLYLIAHDCSAREIAARLHIAKTNLAQLTTSMAADGLIDKTQGDLDRREVLFSITEKGKSYLDERLRAIDENAEPWLGGAGAEENAELIGRVVELLGGSSASR